MKEIGRNLITEDGTLVKYENSKYFEAVTIQKYANKEEIIHPAGKAR